MGWVWFGVDIGVWIRVWVGVCVGVWVDLDVAIHIGCWVDEGVRVLSLSLRGQEGRRDGEDGSEVHLDSGCR